MMRPTRLNVTTYLPTGSNPLERPSHRGKRPHEKYKRVQDGVRYQRSRYPLNSFTMRLALLTLLVAPLLTVVAGATTHRGIYGLGKLAHRQDTACKAAGEHCCVEAQCEPCCEGTCVPKDSSGEGSDAIVGECPVSLLVQKTCCIELTIRYFNSPRALSE
ncbi:hypothetical protein EDC04DRAFT_698394 [Pisolithus marmoratus]|nr:hypothetical protein EDC04DRAFT_698394 [Pisolithus marmoratus]